MVCTSCVQICGCGGIGRHAGLRSQCFGLGVRVSPSAPIRVVPARTCSTIKLFFSLVAGIFFVFLLPLLYFRHSGCLRLHYFLPEIGRRCRSRAEICLENGQIEVNQRFFARNLRHERISLFRTERQFAYTNERSRLESLSLAK